MKYHLKNVTFTGVDNWTDVNRMKEIQKKYPFAEFAILVSKNNTASGENNRYPGIGKIKEVLESIVTDYQLLAVHFCGEVVRTAATTDNPMYVLSALGDEEVKELIKYRVNRIQFNLTKMNGVIRPVNKDNKKNRPAFWNIIIPFKEEGETDLYFYSMKESYIHSWGEYGNIIQGFQDNSGGRGLRESKWMTPMLPFFGYAGGISESNVIEVINEIERAREKLPDDYYYWIDMESSLRDGDDKFDLDKVERICEKLVPYLG